MRGELKKLGITTVSRTTVANVLRAAGFDPDPKRGEGTWAEFVTRHTATLWASDFAVSRTHIVVLGDRDPNLGRVPGPRTSTNPFRISRFPADNILALEG